jgi:hypothetical protein
MIEFKYDGIEIEICNKPEPYKFETAESKPRIGYNKNTVVSVKFWEFIIEDGNLYELARVNSWCYYFMQSFWKRSSKEGNKILLSKTLTHEIDGGKYSSSTLSFDAVVGDKTNKLRIRQENDGKKIGEVFLLIDEVKMLDVVIGKCINMLSPTNDKQDS